MDLTHEEFVHGSSIGQAELSESEFHTRLEDDGSVTVSRWMHDVTPPPFWLKNIRDRFPDFEGNVDRWQIIHYYAPSTICIDVGVAKAGTGAPEGDRSQGVNGYVMDTITPRTERSSHYFWAFMRNYRLESQLITTQLRNGVKGVFAEDEAMLKAQQEAIDANPDHAFYSLTSMRWDVAAPDPRPHAAGGGRTGAAVPAASPARSALIPGRCGGRVVESSPSPGHPPHHDRAPRRPCRSGKARHVSRRTRAARRPRDLRSYSVAESDEDGRHRR